MNISSQVTWLRVRWIKVLATIGLLAVFFGGRGFRSLTANWLELRRLRREIAQLEAANTKAEARLKELKGNDTALEREVRKVGFLKSGEIEYRFEPPKH